MDRMRFDVATFVIVVAILVVTVVNEVLGDAQELRLPQGCFMVAPGARVPNEAFTWPVFCSATVETPVGDQVFYQVQPKAQVVTIPGTVPSKDFKPEAAPTSPAPPAATPATPPAPPAAAPAKPAAPK